MSCVRGFVLAVPEKVRAAYLESAAFNWPLFRDHGATAHWECWEADVPEGAVTPFPMVVNARQGRRSFSLG